MEELRTIVKEAISVIEDKVISIEALLQPLIETFPIS